jgi:hypothetical protein
VHHPAARPSRPMSLASESMGSAHPQARRSWRGWRRWRLDRDQQAIRVAKLRVEVSCVCWVETAVVKINSPLELTDQPIGLDEDGFARIDRVKTMLTPFFTPPRCHHHHSRAHPTIGGNVESKTWAPSFRVCAARRSLARSASETCESLRGPMTTAVRSAHRGWTWQRLVLACRMERPNVCPVYTRHAYQREASVACIPGARGSTVLAARGSRRCVAQPAASKTPAA